MDRRMKCPEVPRLSEKAVGVVCNAVAVTARHGFNPECPTLWSVIHLV
jgi:hypothetical protein